MMDVLDEMASEQPNEMVEPHAPTTTMTMMMASPLEGIAPTNGDSQGGPVIPPQPVALNQQFELPVLMQMIV